VDGVMVGIHASRAKGVSSEFEEHRGYARVTRVISTGRLLPVRPLFLKEHHETTNLKATLVVDCSFSMGYASDGVSKLDYGSTLAASLAHLMLKQQDAVGLITFSDKIEKMLPPKGAHDHLFSILKVLEDTRPSGKTSAASVLQDLAASLKRRGLIILISDLLDKPEEVTKGLKQIRSRGSEVIVFHF
jgi:uncharacterized protein (DUF58 family)